MFLLSSNILIMCLTTVWSNSCRLNPLFYESHDQNFRYVNMPSVCSERDLTTLTVVTCTFGGTLWLTRFFDMVKSESIKVKSDIKSFVAFSDSLSIKVAYSIFYSYLALNVNYLMIASEVCTRDVLCVGYGAVLSGLVVESIRPHLNKFSFFKK